MQKDLPRSTSGEVEREMPKLFQVELKFFSIYSHSIVAGGFELIS